MPVPAIILAAGASRRLGQPKQLVRIGNEALLDRTIRIAHQAGASPILVVLGANDELISATATLEFAQVIHNSDWQLGISSSIHAGIRVLMQLSQPINASLILVCDQPRLSTRHLTQLIAEYASAPEGAIVASAYGQVVGIPAIFPASQFPALLHLQGDSGARALLRKPATPLITVPFPDGELDIDEPADLSSL